jgi:hypothetical protein
MPHFFFFVVTVTFESQELSAEVKTDWTGKRYRQKNEALVQFCFESNTLKKRIFVFPNSYIFCVKEEENFKILRQFSNNPV